MMLELTKSGMSREKSYRIMQSHAKKSFSKNIDLIKLIKKDKMIAKRVSEKRINSIFTYNKHFKNINYIFRRIFK